jgi:putative ABC transport system permease protein
MRHTFRQIAKSPGFSATIILILALGIGANTAIFSVVRAVMLRPLPMHEPERLVRLYETSDPTGLDASQLNLSPQTWLRWRELNTVFTDIGRATGVSLTLAGADGAERIQGSQISHNFFPVLGVQPLLGRNVRPEEDTPGADRVVLISHGFWQNRLAGAADVIGRTITLDGHAHTIIGVMPRHFRHPYRSELWVPFAQAIDLAVHSGRFLYAPARLKPGITPDEARRSMIALCARIEREWPQAANPKAAAVNPLREGFVSDLRPKLLTISAAAAFVLLLAAANVASLLLARHIEREGETSVRAALGASRGRLIRDSLAHSLMLAAAGSALGVMVAAWLIGPLVALSPLGSDATGRAIREFDPTVSLDPTVMAVSVVLTLFTALAFGLLPAWRAGRANLQHALKGSGRSGTLDRGTRRVLGGLVAAEVAVAVVLLVGTGLMVRSFQELVDRPWGFATANRLVFDVSFTPQLRPEHAARADYVDQALGRLRALPGVVSATATTPHPMTAARSLAAISPVGGIEAPRERGYFLIYHRLVTPGYFQDMGVRILRGRALDETDRPDGPRVAVVSETFAKNMWPGQDPLGKEIKRGRINDPRPAYVVVGVAADTRAVLDPTDGQVAGSWFLPYAQNPAFLTDNVTFVLETVAPPETLQTAARAALAGVDRNIALYGFNTIERMIDEAHAEDRFALLLITLFGALGLILSAIGLYGLLSFQVARRTREIGVRAALGAGQGDIVSLIVREAGRLVLIGSVLGCAGAFMASRVLRNQLNEIPLDDPTTYLLAVGTLLVAAALASWLPTRRATRVDPMVALRSE